MAGPSSQDYYERLGVSKSASTDEIKRAYHKLAMQWHPDKNPKDQARANQIFRLISEAYETLSDPSKRLAYDNERRRATEPCGDGRSLVRVDPFSSGQFRFGDDWARSIFNDFITSRNAMFEAMRSDSLSSAFDFDPHFAPLDWGAFGFPFGFDGPRPSRPVQERIPEHVHVRMSVSSPRNQVRRQVVIHEVRHGRDGSSAFAMWDGRFRVSHRERRRGNERGYY